MHRWVWSAFIESGGVQPASLFVGCDELEAWMAESEYTAQKGIV